MARKKYDERNTRPLLDVSDRMRIVIAVIGWFVIVLVAMLLTGCGRGLTSVAVDLPTVPVSTSSPSARITIYAEAGVGVEPAALAAALDELRRAAGDLLVIETRSHIGADAPTQKSRVITISVDDAALLNTPDSDRLGNTLAGYAWDGCPCTGEGRIVLASYAADSPSVLVHEIGHLFGLGHSTIATDAMWPVVTLGPTMKRYSPREVMAIRAAIEADADAAGRLQ